MSDKLIKSWTWDMTALNTYTFDGHDDDEENIRSLLKNRNCDQNMKDMVWYQLKHLLQEEYDVDDKRMKPLNKLTIKQLKLELTLRHLSDTNASKKELVERLQVHEIPSMDKILIYGFIRENEKDLQRGYFVPHYLKEIIVAFYKLEMIVILFQNSSRHHVLMTNMRENNKNCN